MDCQSITSLSRNPPSSSPSRSILITVSSVTFYGHRTFGVLRITLLGVFAGLFFATTLISEITVLTYERPVAAPRGLTYVTTNGYQTHYVAWGKPSRNPIVLIHGAFESTYIWGPVAKLLGTSHHVEAYDLKGYGYTTHVGPYNTQALAHQLAAFLRARHLERPILVGHSLGAGVIAQFVVDYPHVAAGVVFLDGDGLSTSIPASGVSKWIPSLYRTALYDTLVRNNWLVRTIFEAACGPACPPVTPAVLSSIERPLEVAGAEQSFFAYASQPIVGVSASQVAHLGATGVRALVIFGTHDIRFSSQSARHTAQRLRAGAPVMIKNAGHLALWSHPVEVARAINTFATSLSAAK